MYMQRSDLSFLRVNSPHLITASSNRFLRKYFAFFVYFDPILFRKVFGGPHETNVSHTWKFFHWWEISEIIDRVGRLDSFFFWLCHFRIQVFENSLTLTLSERTQRLGTFFNKKYWTKNKKYEKNDKFLEPKNKTNKQNQSRVKLPLSRAQFQSWQRWFSRLWKFGQNQPWQG